MPAPAVIAYIAALMLLGLLGWVAVTGRSISAEFGVTWGNRAARGTDVGILLLGSLLFFAMGSFFYERGEGRQAAATSQPPATTAPAPAPSGSATEDPGASVLGVTATPQETTSGLREGQPDAAAAQALADDVQLFLEDYIAAARGERTPELLAEYWTFPATFYGASNVPDAEALMDVMPAWRPPGERPCRLSVPQVDAVRDDGDVVTVATHVDWEHLTEGTTGSVRVNYVLREAAVGQPFRIASATEPAGQPRAC